MDMIKKQTTSIFAIFILMALLIPAVSADTCSFCEFINISNITRGVTDHALLTNLSADGHPQYILTNGTRAFTGKQSLGGFNLTDLLDPIAAQDAATKNYVDLVNASQTAYTNAAISLANTSMKNYVDTANTSMQAYVDAHTPITDHGLLSNLSGDGHPQYILVSGTRAFTGKQSIGGFNLTDLLDPVALQDAATKNYVDLVNASQTAYTNAAISLANTSMKNYVDAANASMQAYVDAHAPITDHGLLSNLSGDGHPQYLLVNGSRAMTGNLSMGSHSVTGLAPPSVSTDAATKGYVDAATADTAPGSDTQVIYNAGGVEAGNANLTFANDTGTLTATAFVGDGSGLTGIGATTATALTFDVKAGTSALKKGQAVYISGASGSNPIVSAADNTVTAKSRVVGLMIADTNANSQGKVRRAGTLTAVDSRATNTNINPNGETWSAGDLLFATTGGGLTNVRPTSGRSVKAAYSLEGSRNGDTLLVYPLENPVWITGAFGEDVVLRLGDIFGSNKVSIRNYTNTEIASINSQGKGSFNGTDMQGKNISSVANPVAAQDAATKGYVDSVNTSMKNYVDAANASMALNVSLNYASKIGGKVPTGELGSGTANATTYLRGDQTWATPPVLSYTLMVQGLALATVTNNTVYVFGNAPKIPTTATMGLNRIYIPKAGTIKAAEIFAYSTTAGSAETWGMDIALNSATGRTNMIQNISTSSTTRRWSNQSMNTAVVVGDYIEIRSLCPTWVTQRPAVVVFSGNIYIE